MTTYKNDNALFTVFGAADLDNGNWVLNLVVREGMPLVQVTNPEMGAAWVRHYENVINALQFIRDFENWLADSGEDPYNDPRCGIDPYAAEGFVPNYFKDQPVVLGAARRLRRRSKNIAKIGTVRSGHIREV